MMQYTRNNDYFLSSMLQPGPLQPVEQQKNKHPNRDDDNPIIDFKQLGQSHRSKIGFVQNALLKSGIKRSKKTRTE